MSTPLIFDASVEEEVRNLREFAASQPVNMPALLKKLETPEGRAAHMAQMTRQTIRIPAAFLVTFSIEEGTPAERAAT